MGELHPECRGGDGDEGAGLGPRGSLSAWDLCILAGGQTNFPQGSRFLHCQAEGQFIFSLLV